MRQSGILRSFDLLSQGHVGSHDLRVTKRFPIEASYSNILDCFQKQLTSLINSYVH
jgi:hypothetical protein